MNTRQQAEAIAKKAAQDFGAEGYTKAENFQPHEWVIRAVMDGMRGGFYQGLQVEED